jgi:hypothetical protein
MHTGPRLIVAAALVAVAGVAPAAPAHAAACEEGGGVTVVVDFATLDGAVATDCADGDPGSGVEALRAAGHEPTRAAQQAGYFVCRIDGRPADDPCQRASPADAYWSYWHARPGGSWTYSNTGPAERDPAPGTVEGWAFGAGDPPSVAPPHERATAPAPGPSPTSTVPSPAPAATSSRPSPAASTRAVSGPSSPPAAPDGVEPGTDASPWASPSASASPASSATASPELTPGPVVVDRVDDGAGSLAGPLAALGIVLLLAAGGAYQVTRRRARDEGA